MTTSHEAVHDLRFHTAVKPAEEISK